MNVLYLITARGGSKGIPGKNIKLLAGKPLIYYSIDNARHFTSDVNICVSTDDLSIINTVESYGLRVPFVRPEALATDQAGSYEVILHALEYYEGIDMNFDTVVLLQPTSPFRRAENIKDALDAYDNEADMVTSVCKSKSNPYYNLYEEDENGLLMKCKYGNFTRRQDCPVIWQVNGAVYVISVNSLKKYSSFNEFKKIRKCVMEEINSIDLDTLLDWEIAEMLIKNGTVRIG